MMSIQKNKNYPTLLSLDRDAVLTQQEAAFYLGKSVSWLEKERQNGRYGIPYHKVGHSVRYLADDLIEFFKSTRRQYWTANDEPYVCG